MRKYLATIHKRSDHHKKRFAFLVSGTFTLFIFVIWTVVNYGSSTPENLAAEPPTGGLVATEESSPLRSLRSGAAAAFKAIGGTLGEVKQGLEQVNLESEYDEMRNKAFDTYGR